MITTPELPVNDREQRRFNAGVAAGRTFSRLGETSAVLECIAAFAAHCRDDLQHFSLLPQAATQMLQVIKDLFFALVDSLGQVAAGHLSAFQRLHQLLADRCWNAIFRCQ